MTTGKIKTLYTSKEKTEALFPRTKTNAITDQTGASLENILNMTVFSGTEEGDSSIVPVNADTLGGRVASEYATQSYVNAEIAKAQLSGGEGGDIDLSGYATKDELNSATNNLAYISEQNQEGATVPLNADTFDGKNPSAFMQYTNMPDYIVEQGTSGIWTYRKWNSGIAECWGVETGISETVSKAYGNVFYSQRRSSPTIPITINNGVVSLNLIGGGGTDFAGDVRLNNNIIQYYYINPVSYNFTNGIAQYHVIGTWK